MRPAATPSAPTGSWSAGPAGWRRTRRGEERPTGWTSRRPSRAPGSRRRSTSRSLLAGAPVDALAQQVGVAEVPGVLLDEVHDHVAHLDVVTVDPHDSVEVETRVDLPGVADLGAPGLPRIGHDLVVADGAVEVEVRIRVGAVEPRQVVLPLEHAAPPGVLDAGQVAHQAEQGQGRGRHRAEGQLRCGQALALQLEGEPVVVEVLR